MKTTAIYHSADADGWFCREIARKFLPDAELIGWDYGDPTPAKATLDGTEQLYMLDISVPDLMDHPNLIWIDHHKSEIEKYGDKIPGYRIDGVAACRLAWQWFSQIKAGRPTKEDFVERQVSEPLAVRLAGEYDIWDKRDPDAELFQHGLRAQELTDNIWRDLLGYESDCATRVSQLLSRGKVLEYARANEYAEVITSQGFDIEFEGLKFLACCSHECDIRSHLFTAGIKPNHEALFGFTYTGKDWRVSMYHAQGHEHHDLSKIAVKYGGGGHRGACGFQADTLPFLGGKS